MNSNLIEIQACISSIEKMLERAKKLDKEYKEKIGSVDITLAPKVETLTNVIAFSELRSLDLLCKDALERCLPNYPELVTKWYTYDNKGVQSASDVVKDLQIKLIILNQATAILQAYEQTPSLNTKRPIPVGYSKLTEPVHLFLSDISNNCENYDKNVFIMTGFQTGNKELQQIDTTIRETLNTLGLRAHRADDRCYTSDRNLWDNVCTYMVCCKFGIAILEDFAQNEFNPNVALEYGFMRALGKPTLLLKEKRFKPRADILGTLWEEFDMLSIQTTITSAIKRWHKDTV